MIIFIMKIKIVVAVHYYVCVLNIYENVSDFILL